jgi:nucleoid DNA-binding protein
VNAYSNLQISGEVTAICTTHDFFVSSHSETNESLTLNSKDFTKAVASRLGITQQEAARLLESASLVVRESLAEESKLTIQKLGSFQVKTRKSRIAYIPALGRKALVPPQRAVHFLPSQWLKDKIRKEPR